MAGSNQSVNLGGMLSQIGGAVGSMGSVGEKFVRPIENMSRPDVDMEDPTGLKKLMDWQTQMGRTQEASVTSNRISEADRREAENRRIGVLESQDAREEEAAKAEAQRKYGENLLGTLQSRLDRAPDETTKANIRKSMEIVSTQTGAPLPESTQTEFVRLNDKTIFNKQTGTFSSLNAGGNQEQSLEVSMQDIEDYVEGRPRAVGDFLYQKAAQNGGFLTASDFEAAQKLQRGESGLGIDTYQAADQAFRQIDEILTMDVGGWESMLMSWAPGTDAAAQEARLNSLRSKLGFDKIQQLKASGVSLGPITEKEWPKIEQEFAALDPKDPVGLRKGLKAMRSRLMSSIDRDAGPGIGSSAYTPERGQGWSSAEGKNYYIMNGQVFEQTSSGALVLARAK